MKTILKTCVAIRIVVFVIVGIVFSSCVTAPNSEIVQKNVELSESYLDLVRWWDIGKQDPAKELMIESREQLAIRIPKRQDPKIVVMMYHNIVFGRTGGEYNRDLYNFEHDLVFLRNRTEIIGLDELVDIKAGKKKLETDASIITFDDGDLSIYALVFPLLKKYDIKATFFIITDFVGTVGYVSWDQLKEIDAYRNARGEKLFTIGSHSLDHKRFDTIPAEAIPRELMESKLAIERKIQSPVSFFALPFGAGAGRKEIIEAAKAAGYWGIRTSTTGVMNPEAIDLYNIPAFYVMNGPTDSLVQQVYSLLGR
jgi:peptidoglycan/xylan/chitin deacetylase (PgdA/CDA1 family)